MPLASICCFLRPSFPARLLIYDISFSIYVD
nr:MAG TPA: hypothetical protein [Caudoviricetes sp.]